MRPLHGISLEIDILTRLVPVKKQPYPFRQDHSFTVAARNRVLSRDRKGAVGVVIS